MRERIAKSVFWIVLSRGGVQVLAFLSTLAVARLLSPSDYGLMALAGVWTATIAMVAEMGLGSAIIQFRDLEDRDLNSCFWLTMGIAGIGYLGLCIAAPVIAAWFSSPMLSDVLRVVGLTLPVTALRIVPDGLLRKRLALDKISQAEIAAAIVTIPVVVGLAWAGAGVWALVAAAIVGPLTQSVVTFWFMHWWPGMQIGGAHFREVLSYSAATVGSKVCWMLREQADALVLGKVSGDVLLGFYSMAKQLATLPVSKVSAMVNQLASPVMAELQTNQEALRESFLRGTRLVASATFPLSLGLMLVAEDLVRVALTDKWLSAVPVFRVLCLYAAIRSVDVLLPPILMARYRANFLFIYTLALLGVMPLAFWIGAVQWGAMGVAIACVMVYPIIMLWMAREAFREVGLSWKTFWLHIWEPTVATLCMVVAMLLAQWGLVALWGNFPLVRLATMGVSGTVAYAACLWGIGGAVYRDLQEVAGWLVRKDLPLIAEI